MKHFSLLLSGLAFTLMSFTPSPQRGAPSMRTSQEPQLVINNCILAKVHNKSVSVVDVMKQMDVLFVKRFPDFSRSPVARYQFYQANWRHALQELVDKELILADADEVGLPVAKGDVREEMERMFGPRVLETLQDLGLTYSEAWKILRDDIAIRRMISYRVNSKAMKEVSPALIKATYAQSHQETPPQKRWTYQVLSIRGADEATLTTLGEELHLWTKGEEISSLEKIQAHSETLSFPQGVTLTLSAPFQHDEASISTAYREGVSSLSPGEISLPILQQNRRDASPICRLFQLHDCEENLPPSFAEKAKEIESQLVGEAIDRGSEKYVQKLKEHFGVAKDALVSLPDDFQPFQLR